MTALSYIQDRTPIGDRGFALFSGFFPAVQKRLGQQGIAEVTFFSSTHVL